MRNAKKFLFVVLLIIPFLRSSGQDSTLITIRGEVFDPNTPNAFFNLLIVNKRTHKGEFGEPSGNFEIKAFKSDTILVGSIGYVTQKLCFADSVKREVYNVRIILRQLQYRLPEVEVISERELKEIHKDLESLGYDEKALRTTGVDAFASPITALYQLWSKRERSKRKLAELENEERKRELLKELFKKYVEYEIINLSDESFDDFIDFCNVPDDIIRSMTQYDFILYVKKKYELYTSLGPYKGTRPDYYYEYYEGK